MNKFLTFLLAVICLCATAYSQVIVTEGFENYTTLPPGWFTQKITGSSSVVWARVTSATCPTNTAHTGAGLVYYNSDAASSGCQAILCTPSFDLSNRGSNTATVSVWLYRHNYNSTKNPCTAFEVFINSSQSITGATQLALQSDPSTTLINTLYTRAPIVSAIGWYQYTFAIPASFTGSTNYIIFRSTSDYYNNIHIDDVSYTTYPAPMLYSSATATQTNTNFVGKGFANQEIIGMQVVTTGAANPLALTQFNLSTTGTTNPSDISSAKVYYTGQSNAFATTNQFGSTVPNPNGNFSVSGNQSLANGINYFWLVYDISPTSGLDRYVDATFNTVVVAGNTYTPTVTAPTGNRKIIYIPLYESFENTTFPPTNWTNTVGLGTLMWERVTAGTYPTNSPKFGSAMAQYNCYSASSGQWTYLTTPPVDLTSNRAFYFSLVLYRHNYSTSTNPPSKLEVFVNSTNSLDGAIPLNLQGTQVNALYPRMTSEPAVTTAGWYQYLYDIPADYLTGNTYFFIKGTSDYYNNLQIDEVALMGLPPIQIPQLQVPTNGNPEVLIPARFVWSAISGASSYRIQIATDAEFNNIVLNQTPSTYTYSATSSQLNYSSTYYWRVNAIVDGITTTWSSTYSFTTMVHPVSAFPYRESFEAGSASWVASGTNSSWAWGVPNKELILTAATGSRCWTTNLTGNYNDYELSYLTSPYFDFSNYTIDPILQFAFIASTEGCCDKVWVEYSINGGNWTTLGTSSNGIQNWYNNPTYWAGENIYSDNEWKKSAHVLTGFAGAYNVRFRFVMSSDVSVTNPGPGIDDILIDDIYPPVLLTPENQTFNVDTYPTLTWQAVNGACHYEFEMASDRTFSSLVNNQTYVTGTSAYGYYFYPSSDLPHNSTFFWRVKAHNPLGKTSEYSEIFEFTTKLETPELVSPGNTFSNIPLNTYYEWNEVAGAASYLFELATDADFNNIVYSNNSTTNQIGIPFDLQMNAVYYWRVKAQNNSRVSDYSQVFSFRTIPFDFYLPSFYDVCNGSRVNFGPITVEGGSGNFSYQWQPSTSLSNANTNNPFIASASQNMSISVLVTDNVTGASVRKNSYMYVYPGPRINLTSRVNIRRGNSVSLGNYLSVYSSYGPFTYYWYNTRNWSSNDTNPTVNPLVTTTYYCRVTDRWGCTSATASIKVMVYSIRDGAETAIAGESIIVFPNPTNDYVTVNVEYAEQTNVKIRLINSIGQQFAEIVKDNVNSVEEKIDMRNLPAGLYLIEMTINGETYTEKVIKE